MATESLPHPGFIKLCNRTTCVLAVAAAALLVVVVTVVQLLLMIKMNETAGSFCGFAHYICCRTFFVEFYNEKQGKVLVV